MVQPGKTNSLRVVKILDFGIYLDGGELGEILMPKKWVPNETQAEDTINAFIYFDSEDRPIATTMKPKAEVGEFAYLKVKDTTPIGAFLDWGLDKDILVPFKEQNAKMETGRSYLVYLYIDPRSKRIVASAKLEKFLDVEPVNFDQGQQVDLLIWTPTELGYKAIINQKHLGMLYKNEIFQDVYTGQQVKGYIKNVRPDGKIDLVIEKPGYEKIDELASHVLKIINAHGGYVEYTDKSPAEEIYSVFQMSKKNFKKSIGALYKNKIIALEDNGIRVVE
jgi:uncharacterized protein